MAVRRRRPLVPPPYPRRNRYTPSSIQTALHELPAYAESSQRSVCLSSSNRTRFAGLRLGSWSWGKLHYIRSRLAPRVRAVPLPLLSKSETLCWFLIWFRDPFWVLELGSLSRIVTHFNVEMCYDFVTFLIFQVFANLTISFTGVILANTR